MGLGVGCGLGEEWGTELDAFPVDGLDAVHEVAVAFAKEEFAAEDENCRGFALLISLHYRYHLSCARPFTCIAI